MYQVVYQDGRKVNEGKILAGGSTVEQVKSEYQSLAKKAVKGKEFMDKVGIK
jgi:hypothetical protein